MKKLVCVFVVMLLIFSLCSCQSSKPVDMSKIETQDVFCGEFEFKIPQKWEYNIEDKCYYASETDYFTCEYNLFDGSYNEDNFKKTYQDYSAKFTENSKLVKADTLVLSGMTFYEAEVLLNIGDTNKTLVICATHKSRTLYTFCMISESKTNYKGYLNGILNTIELKEAKSICEKKLNDYVEWYSIFYGELKQLSKIDFGYVTNYMYFNDYISLNFNERNSDKSITNINVTSKKGTDETDDDIFFTSVAYVDDSLKIEEIREILSKRKNEYSLIEKNGILYVFTDNMHALSISRVK